MPGFKQWLMRIPKHSMAALIALLVGGVMGWMNAYDFNNTYESKFLDLRFMLRDARPPQADDAVIIVAIDDQSLASLGVRWPWPRSLYAQAIDRLSQAGARVVAFDFIFSEAGTGAAARQENRALSEAITRSRSWIVLGSKFYSKKTEIGVQTAYVAALPEVDPGKTHVGYVNYWADPDGTIRHAALLRRHQNKLYYSFALKILSRYYRIDEPAATLTPRRLTWGPLNVILDRAASLLINYRGGAGSFKTISYENLLNDEIFQGLASAGLFKEKIVLIGPTFTEAQDNHVTPYFQAAGLVSGVELHANTLNTIIRGDYLRTGSPWQVGLILLFLPLGLALLNVRFKPLRALIVLLAFIVMYVAAAVAVFAVFNWVIPVFNVILALFLTHLGLMAYLLLTEERRSRYIKSVFSRYVSPKVVDQLVQNVMAELKLGGNKQVITVLFSDIRGFTTLSEQLAPEAVVELLNEYFQTWTDVIFRYDGMVDKFIGDAIMAIFGAPVAHLDDPFRAVQAALAMQEALRGLQAKWAAQGKPVLQIGVGINTGEAIVGNMGSQQAMGFTAIGDTVNLASRLEGKNKELGTTLLISESTYAAIRNRITVRPFQAITVKGKAKPMTVYEVVGLAAES